MWKCAKCGRVFEREGQTHSCKKIPLEEHFKNKDKAKKLLGYLISLINKQIGEVKIISLPCCIHLFGKYDFMAVLPRRDNLEIRFSLNRKIDSSRLKIAVPISAKSFKNCVDIASIGEINEELIKWLDESYHLKD